MPRETVLWKLVRRDLALHPGALALPGGLGLLLLAFPLIFSRVPPEEARLSILPVFTGLSAGLGCLQAILFTVRERAAGTLPDLVALPVARRDLVHLRWVEALVFMGIFTGGFWAAALVFLPAARTLPAPGLLLIPGWVFLWMVALNEHLVPHPRRWLPFLQIPAVYAFLILRSVLTWSPAAPGALDPTPVPAPLREAALFLFRWRQTLPAPLALLGEAVLLGLALAAAHEWSVRNAEAGNV